MSEPSETPPAKPSKGAHVVEKRTATGAILRWEAPSAESLLDAFPGLKIKALCGVGGMGAVYRAEQTRLGRAVAVKVLPPLETPDPEARERFEREARILSDLNHPHVLHIHDFGALPDGTLYIVTEWAAGGDLRTLLAGKAHSLAQVQTWVRQISDALTETHAHGIIHRDLKPGNVLVFGDGRLSLADFGLAQATGGGLTAPLTTNGSLFGTFEYMAPEQMEAAGNVSPATDLYALGVMTYQMITGRVPHCAYTRPSRLVKVPPEVDAFLDSALAHDAKRRPANAADFSKFFELACNAPQRRRQRQLIGLGIVLVVLALAWSRAEVILADRRLADYSSALEIKAPRTPRPLAAATAAGTAAAVDLVSLRLPAPEFESVFSVETIHASLPLVELRQAPAGGPDQVLPSGPALVPWTSVLTGLKPEGRARAGDWKMVEGELVSGEDACALSLPVIAATRYDIAIEFTRTAGVGAVVVFLPTTAGLGALELDALNAGIAGLQIVNGADIKRHSESLPARIRNGAKHRLTVEVRGDQVAASWDGEPRMIWDLKGRELSLPPLWPVRTGLGVGSWRSSTIFHRIAYRVLPAGVSP